MIPTRSLFFGGRIYTMSEQLPQADAMLVEGDRISWIGSAAELSAVPSDSYRLVDLDGGNVLPGFIDSHVHLFKWARSRRLIDLSRTRSIRDVQQLVKVAAAQLSPADKNWIAGLGWKRERWRDGRWPNKGDLDRVVPDRPVILSSKDDHSLWVNSRALQLAGIDSSTPNPSAGVIERDEHGEATGILKERAAWWLRGLIKPLRKGQALNALQDAFAGMFRCGCVGVSNFDDIEGFKLLQQLDLRGKLPVRVIHYLPLDHLGAVKELGLRSGYGSQRLAIGGIKLYADGALGSQTALLLKPYLGSRDNCGIAILGREELIEGAVSCAGAGLSCAIHAIGDLANRNALDAIESARRLRTPGLYHRIEHCQIVAPPDVCRFQRLGVIASMQPSHATADIDVMKKYLGRRRYHSYRFRTFAELGIPLAFGSDAPIEPLNPLLGIQAAIDGRKNGGSERFNRSQLLPLTAAIRGFTLGGAIAVGQHGWRGSLAPGMKADFVIWDRDLTRLEMARVERAEVMATYIDGVAVYSQEGFDA